MAPHPGPEGKTRTDRPAPAVSLAACLAATARRLGAPGLEAALAGVDPARLTPRAALRLARRAGLKGRRLRLDWPALLRRGDALPGLVGFADGSWMLLDRVAVVDGTPLAFLADPRAPEAEPFGVDRHRFEQVWTGALLLFRVGSSKPGVAGPFGWPRVLRQMAAERGLLRDGAAATLGLGLLAVAPVLPVELLMGRVLSARGSQSLLVLLGGLGAVLAMEAVFRWARGAVTAQLVERVNARLSTRLFDRLLAAPTGAVEAMPTGEARARFAALGTMVRRLGEWAPRLAVDAAAALFALPLLAFLDWHLAVGAVTVLAGAGALLVMGRSGRLAATQARVAADMGRDAFLHQTLARGQAVRALALAPERRREWDRLTAGLARARLAEAKRVDAAAAVGLAAERLMVPGLLAAAVGVATLTGTPVAVAPLAASVLLLQRLADPLASLAGLLGAEAEARAAARALGGLLKAAPEPVGASPRPAPGPGRLTLEGVSFRYPGQTAPALEVASLTIEPGAWLGITGRSGAGKTTLVRLLQRRFAPGAGTVRLDGVDLHDYDPDTLRRAVTVVPQTSAILAGTIRDTLVAARPDATFAEMTRAAEIAGVTEFVEHLPRGFETVLGEGAPSLSAGQRQRLALARAVLAAPKVLVLDEALSALDADMLVAVEERLRAARLGLTTILVTHRLASLVEADAVLVMADGQIRDQGRHADLAERSGPYGLAWARQGGAAAPEPGATGGPALALP